MRGPELFSGVLKKYRTRLGMTPRQVADRASCDPSYIRMMERGARTPSPELLQRLMTALQLSPDERAVLAATLDTKYPSIGIMEARGLHSLGPSVPLLRLHAASLGPELSKLREACRRTQADHRFQPERPLPCNSSQVFAVQLADDRMAPLFTQGCIILATWQMPTQIARPVIAHAGGEIICGLLSVTDTHLVVLPLNPSYDIRRFTFASIGWSCPIIDSQPAVQLPQEAHDKADDKTGTAVPAADGATAELPAEARAQVEHQDRPDAETKQQKPPKPDA